MLGFYQLTLTKHPLLARKYALKEAQVRHMPGYRIESQVNSRCRCSVETRCC